jgi:hypothetical protein
MAKPACTGQLKKTIPGKQKICLYCIKKAAHIRLVEEKQYFHIIFFYFYF